MQNEVKLLTSWKEIAAYLGRGVRTVQRWERVLGLPVRRPEKAARGIVRASADDLKEWLARGWEHRPISPVETLHGDLDRHRRLRQANRELVRDLRQKIEVLKVESAALYRSPLMSASAVAPESSPEPKPKSKAQPKAETPNER